MLFGLLGSLGVAAYCKLSRENKILGQALDDASSELNSYRRTLHQLPKVRILMDLEGRPMAASVGDVAIVSSAGTPSQVLEYDCINGTYYTNNPPLAFRVEIDETVKLL